MRKFTKQHNDITWLFPDIIDNNEEASENWFDKYEDIAKYLVDTMNINDSDVFTKDDLIDAFMKGASIAQQSLTQFYNVKLDSLKTYNEVKKCIDDFNKQLKT